MPVKIVVTTPAIAFDAREKRVVAAKWLRVLDDTSYSADLCSNYFAFGGLLDEADVRGGEIRLRFNPTNQKLESLVSYECDRKLNTAEKNELLSETRGQLSDGIGEGPCELPTSSPIVFVNLSPDRGKSSIRQSASKNLKIAQSVSKKKVNIWAAAKNGNLEKIQLAIDCGIDVNIASKGFYPLDLAVGAGQVEAVKLLIANGANLELRDPMDFTALHTCIASSSIVGRNREKILNVLLEAGSKVNAKSKQAGRPLDIAFNYGRGTSIKNALINHGAKKS